MDLKVYNSEDYDPKDERDPFQKNPPYSGVINTEGKLFMYDAMSMNISKGDYIKFARTKYGAICIFNVGPFTFEKGGYYVDGVTTVKYVEAPKLLKQLRFHYEKEQLSVHFYPEGKYKGMQLFRIEHDLGDIFNSFCEQYAKGY